MKLKFKALEVEHFRCFTTKQTFRLSPSPGLWFLRGRNTVDPQLASNGSGKSSLFEAVTWIIYGRTSKNLKNTDIRPWKGKGTPKGTLFLDIDGDEHSICREAKTNGLSINGREVGPEEAAKLIQLPFEVWINTLLLAQDSPLFFDRTSREKMQLFTEVLPLERWEERSERAAGRVRELEGLEHEITGEIAGVELALTQNASSTARTQEWSRDWEAERQGKAEKLIAEIKTLQTQLDTQGKQLDTTDLAHDLAWTRLREMREDLPHLREIMVEAQHDCNAWEATQTRLEEELQTLRRELDEVRDTCPTCGQTLKGSGRDKHRAEVTRKIKAVEKQIQRFMPEKLSKAFDAAHANYGQLATKLREAEVQTDELQSKLNFLKPSVERLKTQIVGLKASQKERTEESNPYIDQLQELRRQKAKLEAQKEELEEDRLTAQKQIERTKYWVKGFKDVALYRIEEVLKEVEAVTNVILGEVGLGGWEVFYDIERETKSGTVQRGISVRVNPPGASGKTLVRWESWSGGESQRLRIVGAVALSEVLLRHAAVSSNLEVFDEPGKYMSGSGIEDLCAYLAHRAKTQGKTIWLVDHLAREGQLFAGTATVTKTPTGSIVK